LSYFVADCLVDVYLSLSYFVADCLVDVYLSLSYFVADCLVDVHLFPLPRLDRQTSTYGALTKNFNNNNLSLSYFVADCLVDVHLSFELLVVYEQWKFMKTSVLNKTLIPVLEQWLSKTTTQPINDELYNELIIGLIGNILLTLD